MSEIAPEDVRDGDVVRIVRAGCADGWNVELVERAPEPEIPVGTTGTATVRGVEGVRVGRSTFLSGGWLSFVDVGGHYAHTDDEVTGFVPDETYPHPGLTGITILGPEVVTDADETVINYRGAHYVRQDEVLTDERVEQIRAEERERLARCVEEIGRLAKTLGRDMTQADEERWRSTPEVLRHLSVYEPDSSKHASLAAWLRGGAQ